MDSTFRLNIYMCYGYEDEQAVLQLKEALQTLSEQGLISEWHDNHSLGGMPWGFEREMYMARASIILLLVSPNFLRDQYCYYDMQWVQRQHNRRKNHVISILMHPVDWDWTQPAPFSVLPRNGQPIMEWHHQDQAFLDVAEGIREVIKDLIRKESETFHGKLCAERQKRGWTHRDLAEKIGTGVRKIQRWEAGESFPSPFYRMKLSELFEMDAEALGLTLALEREVGSFTVQVQTSKWVSRYYQVLGKTLLYLGQYKRALASYEKALFIQPNNLVLSLGKGEALLGLQRSEEALTVYELVLLLDPDSSAAHRGKGRAYEQRAQQMFDSLKQQAQECYKKARELGTE